MERTKRFVQVQNLTYIDEEKESTGREFQVKDTDLVIYDTIQYPYYKFEGRLWISKNLDDTETLARNVFQCLGTIVKEYDTLSNIR